MTQTNEEQPLDARIAERLAASFGPAPTWAVVLGSGLGVLLDELEDATVVPHAELGLPTPGVAGHAGRVAVGTLRGTRVALMSGRVHLYEGHPPARVVAGVRAFARWGVQCLGLTNAAGSARPDWAPGTVMRMVDHIDMSGGNPLVGPNRDDLGPRFPDMSAAYDPELGARADAIAAELGAPFQKGVYVCVRGPSYETPAEVRMLRGLGADVIGMSTVPEAIAAVHAGMRVAAWSVVSNYGAGLVDEHPDHAMVTATVSRSVAPLARVLARLVAEPPASPAGQ